MLSANEESGVGFENLMLLVGIASLRYLVLA